MDAGPEWPTVTYGIEYQHVETMEDSHALSVVESETMGHGYFAGFRGAGALVETSGDFSTTEESESTTETAQEAVKAASESTTTTCALECTLPTYVDAPAEAGEYILSTSGIGQSDGQGREGCGAEGKDDALVYIWRWTESIESDGDAGASISTCHTQCTCTPDPPKCEVGRCADPFCKKCIGWDAPETVADHTSACVAGDRTLSPRRKQRRWRWRCCCC